MRMRVYAGSVLAWSFLAAVFRGCGGDVDTIHLAPAPHDRSTCVGGSAVLLCEDWRDTVEASRTQIFPPVSAISRETVPRLAASKAFLKAMNLLDVSAAKRVRRKKAKGVEVETAAPGGGDASHSDASCIDKDGPGAVSSDTEGDDHFDPDHYAEIARGGADARADAEVGGAAAAEARVNVSRKISFGPWSISEVHSNGVHTGWGGNCGCHYGTSWGRDGKPKNLACKQNLSMTKDSSDLDTQRRLCKAWLLMGRNIRSSDKCGREIHVGIRREAIDVRLEHELDAEAAEYLLSLT